MGIENVFDSPEKQARVKELTREFNITLNGLRTLGTKYGITGIDEIQKQLVTAYRDEKLKIENEYVNLDADITYVPPTRRRKPKEDAAGQVDETGEVVKDEKATKQPKGGKKKADGADVL